MANRWRASGVFGAMDVRAAAAQLTGKRIVAFGGSGISRTSGLPIANELTDEVLRCLEMPGHFKEELISARPPFELFIETLAACSEMAPIYDIYQRGSPCLFHFLCAQLWSEDLLSSVVTTNFDLLFEQAFDVNGINYNRSWRETELECWSPAKGRLPLIKLHGSVHDKQSLAATIRRVANQRGVRAREIALRTAFLNTEAEFIVIAGYSGSDRFDISPALGRLASSAPLVALVAHTSRKGRGAIVEQLRDNSNAGPFSVFQGIRIECDTDALLLEMISPNRPLIEPSTSPRLQ